MSDLDLHALPREYGAWRPLVALAPDLYVRQTRFGKARLVPAATTRPSNRVSAPGHLYLTFAESRGWSEKPYDHEWLSRAAALFDTNDLPTLPYMGREGPRDLPQWTFTVEGQDVALILVPQDKVRPWARAEQLRAEHLEQQRQQKAATLLSRQRLVATRERLNRVLAHLEAQPLEEDFSRELALSPDQALALLGVRRPGRPGQPFFEAAGQFFLMLPPRSVSGPG